MSRKKFKSPTERPQKAPSRIEKLMSLEYAEAAGSKVQASYNEIPTKVVDVEKLPRYPSSDERKGREQGKTT